MEEGMAAARTATINRKRHKHDERDEEGIIVEVCYSLVVDGIRRVSWLSGVGRRQSKQTASRKKNRYNEGAGAWRVG